MSLKNSISVNKFIIKTRLNVIESTNKKDFKKILLKNFIYVFI